MMAKKEADTSDEVTIGIDERFRKPFFLISFLAIALILVMIFAYLISDSVPRPPTNAESDQSVWFAELPNSTWTIDSSTKKEELEELSFHTVSALRFSQKDTEKDYIVCYLDTPEMVMVSKVRMGKNSLLLSIDGFELELWYTENEDREYRTLTLKGKDAWLFFTLDE